MSVLARSPENCASAGLRPGWEVLARLPWSRLWPVGILSALVGAFLIWPVLSLIANDLTPTGMAEESIGYRYFYSLRILYADHERPWLPQGHLISVSHLAIHLVLTALGYPPTQLFPRIDHFAFAASILPILLTAVCFFWAVWPLRDPRGQLLIALLLLAEVFDRSTFGGYHLVQADYYSWVHALSLVSMGAVLRVVQGRISLSVGAGSWVGALAAAAITIKPTHLIFVLPVAILLAAHAVAQQRWLSLGLGLAAALLTAAGGTLAVTLAYYLGDTWALVRFASILTTFLGAVNPTMSVGEWIGGILGNWQQVMPIHILLAMMPLLALSAVALPNRLVSLSLLPGGAAALYFAWRRYYSNTLIETNEYALFALVLWGALVIVPVAGGLLAGQDWGRSGARRRWVTPLALIGLALTLAVGLRAADRAAEGRAALLPGFRTATIGARALAAHLENRPGRVAFLIPDNTRRPTTVDSAIYKGGMNIDRQRWGVSPYIESMFPDRYYFLGKLDRDRDPPISRFNRIVFVSVANEGGDADAAALLREYYRVSLSEYECDFRANLGDQEVVSCER